MTDMHMRHINKCRYSEIEPSRGATHVLVLRSLHPTDENDDTGRKRKPYPRRPDNQSNDVESWMPVGAQHGPISLLAHAPLGAYACTGTHAHTQRLECGSGAPTHRTASLSKSSVQCAGANRSQSRWTRGRRAHTEGRRTGTGSGRRRPKSASSRTAAETAA